MNPRCITLIAYGPFERKFLDHAAGTVRTLFRCPVELREQHLDTAGFYNAARILGEEEPLRRNRMLLLEATRITLRNALRLLGVSAPERM